MSGQANDKTGEKGLASMTSGRVAIALGLAVLAGLSWWMFDKSRTSEVVPENGAAGAEADGQKSILAEIVLPEEFSERARLGQKAFDGNCAACHGQNATGLVGLGPPLVHRIYEPSHHADAAFHVAVANGVRSHHWKFGNMPPVDGLTRADVDMIVAYVRELQRANGIN